jgi:hypothetical protein
MLLEEADSRMLTMFSALEALITLGKCRELPVAGFVDDMFVLGIIVSSSPQMRADRRTKSRAYRSLSRQLRAVKRGRSVPSLGARRP